MYLIFDTETTGLPKNFNAPVSDSENWPRCVQLAWQIHDQWGELIGVKNYIIKPDGFSIPFNATKIHGITTDRAEKQGVELKIVLDEFLSDVKKSKFGVGHNIQFDYNILGAEYYRVYGEDLITDFPALDTGNENVATFCQLPGGKGGRFKKPKLTELHEKLFGVDFAEAHNAAADVEATARCFLELIRIEIYSESELNQQTGYLAEFQAKNPNPIKAIGLDTQPYNPNDLSSAEIQEIEHVEIDSGSNDNISVTKVDQFGHLHNHSEFSILQAYTKIPNLISAASKDGHSVVALTDTGNMMGAYNFCAEIDKYNKSIADDPTKKELKGILGIELYVCGDHTDKSFKDNGNLVVFLAKNRNGYHNLAKMASIAYTEGMYYVPRISKPVVEQFKEDVIVLSGGLSGEIPNKLLNVGEEQAKDAAIWWKEKFGEDFYLEICRHGLEEEDFVNQKLLDYSKELNIPIIAANNTFYLEKEESEMHDILLCIRDGEQQETPVGKGRGFRFGFPNNEFYFKQKSEMEKLFADIPEALENIGKIADQIENFVLAREVLLPKFSIPQEFIHPEDETEGSKKGENAFLRHLTYEGAKIRYPEITDEIKERLDFELETIERTGYPGYFLIVQDFTTAAREMGVSVGPGRGSAAGSAVAYCVGITNVDPIEYDLLFERFLNPDRVSLPDIDIDFDDEGRQKVINYVIEKYGSNQVAQIITYGTMAAKSSIRDTARVLGLPLPEANQIAKTVPDIKLKKLFNMDEAALKKKLRDDDMQKARDLMAIAKQENKHGEVVRKALQIEGAMRNTGIHACGVIITPDDITNFVPVATAKDSDLVCTQFDNSVVEDAGLLKMDFLGLKTLTLIKDACKIVKERHNIDLDPDEFPKDDVKTYELFQRGETVGIFQYESPGMQKYMKELKPTVFADLIAMNALYRPGPLEYIPSFIKRKHGKEEISYDLEDMKEFLEETYGITVYQEQVMLLSQKLAGFTKGEADVLRKAMGKKIFALLEKLKPKFVEQAMEKGHAKEKLEKIWKDWEAFAAYAFNKSHSTCYAWVAYQTAYLKAHYPAEYMASVLSNNMNDLKTVTFFMEECKRMGIEVLGPDVNESTYKFTVNDEGNIRFGLGALKGVGGNAVDNLVTERQQEGNYSTIFEFAKRVDLRMLNKKNMEALAYSGAFDNFGFTRSTYFAETPNGTGLDIIVKFAQSVKREADMQQNSLFGGMEGMEVTEPQIEQVEEWPLIQKLEKEKEVVGIYISGHPLDIYKVEIEHCMTHKVDDLNIMQNGNFTVGGVLSEVIKRKDKNGNPFVLAKLVDYSGEYKIALFRDQYSNHSGYFEDGNFIFIQGKMQEKSWRPGEFEMVVNKMGFLQDYRNSAIKELVVECDLEHITGNFVNELDLISTEYPGQTPVGVLIRAQEGQEPLRLQSRSLSVEISNDCIRTLESIDKGLVLEFRK